MQIADSLIFAKQQTPRQGELKHPTGFQLEVKETGEIWESSQSEYEKGVPGPINESDSFGTQEDEIEK